nr:MAG TPA: hypothetical protein [Caudoviricetes sp.]
MLLTPWLAPEFFAAIADEAKIDSAITNNLIFIVLPLFVVVFTG